MTRILFASIALAIAVSACQREEQVSVAPAPPPSTNPTSGSSSTTAMSSPANPSPSESIATGTPGSTYGAPATGGSSSADVGATTSEAGGSAGSGSSAAELMKAKGCFNCHDRDTKKVGPAFKDVAAKKPSKAALVAKLKEGKGHMKIAASDAELDTMVQAVLAMK